MCVSTSTVHRALHHAAITYKRAQRDDGRNHISKWHPFFDDCALGDAISVDETCFYLNDSQRSGWSRRGSRVRKAKMASRVKVSMLLAIDRSGIVARDVTYGNYNSQSFASFVTLLPSGRRIVLDNVSFHKSKAARLAADSASSSFVFTPPYCPWFNPTEYAFSVAKSTYRRNMTNVRSVSKPDLEGFALEALADVTAEKCSAFFDHAQHRVEQCANNFIPDRSI